jgi:hypothetical protein
MKPMTDKTKRTCRATKPDGTSCIAKTQERKNWCYFHDPELAEERRAAQARGGQGNRAPSLPIDAPDFAPETVSDLRPLLVATINQVRRAEISPNAATAICNLANTLMKALDDRDLRQRLSDLEQLLAQSNKKKGPFDPDVEPRE